MMNIADCWDTVERRLLGGPLSEPCAHCGRELLTLSGAWALAGDDDVPGSRRAELEALPKECPCEGAAAEREAARVAQEKAEADAEWRRLVHRSEEAGVPDSWLKRRMTDWVRETEAQVAAYRAVKAFFRLEVSDVADHPRGLYVVGDIGTGKTFLVSCLVMELMRKGVRVRWAHVSKVLRELRDSFDNRHVSEVEIMRRYTVWPDVLVLDDLGKEKPTEWALDQLFSIVNERYDAGLPVIVTTNYGGQNLVKRLTPRPDRDGWADDTTAQAIVDRLRGMSEVIKLEGRSWRGEN